MKRASQLIGRDAELAIIGGARQRAHRGQGGVLFVIGDAGVGKSALWREALRADPAPLIGRTAPTANATAQALAEIALALVRAGANPFADECRVHRGALRVLLPGAGLAEGETEQPTPMHVVDALLALSAQLDPRVSEVVVLEDVHWSDQFTLQAVDYLGERTRGAPMLVLATTRRDPAVLDLARRMRSQHTAEMVEVAALADDDVARLVASCLDGTLPRGLLETVRVADGVPLTIEELLFAYERTGTLSRPGAEWVFDSDQAFVPDGVRDGVVARLSGMDESHRFVTEAAAVLARPTDAAFLVAALSLDAASVDAALTAGVAAGLLVSLPATPLFSFAHELVREAVADQLGAGEQVRLARLLALPLAASERLDDLDRSAALSTLAGDAEAAARSFERGAHLCVDRGLPADAVARFDSALGLVGTAATALPLREQLLHALALMGDVERARTEAELVRRQLRAAGASVERVDACAIACARAALNASALAEAAALLDEVAVPSRSDALSLGAVVALERAEFERSAAMAGQVVASQLSTPAQRCEAFEVLGRLARRHDLEAAEAFFTDAVATAELADLDLWAARASHELATIAQLRRLEVDGLVQARRRAEHAGAPGLTAAIDFHLAAVHGVRFETADALDAARRFLDVSHRLGATRQEAWAWILIGQAHASAPTPRPQRHWRSEATTTKSSASQWAPRAGLRR